MATGTVHPVRAPRAAAVLRDHAEVLNQALQQGSWTPTCLEQKIATLLNVATAGDGTLTVARVRAALWEGTFPLFQENDGRLAALLTDTLKLLQEPTAPASADACTAATAVDDVRRFLITMARGRARA